MAEEAAATDLIAGGRLQLGISRGSPEPALDGAGAFGYRAAEGTTMADVARTKTDLALHAMRGAGVVMSDPAQTGVSQPLAVQPHSEGLDRRIWWGSGSRATARWTAEQGLNLMSSTLLTEDTGVPFDELQAEQIQVFRDAWAEAGWEWDPRVSVSRSVVPVVSDLDRRYFGSRADEAEDQVGVLEGVRSRFGRSYTGEPDVVAAELVADAAVQAADTLLVLGSDFPYQQFYPERTTTIQVDIRGSQLGRRHPVDLGLVGDVGDTAAALLPRLNRNRRRRHLDDATEHYRKSRAKLDELAVASKGSKPIHPQYLARLIDEAAADDAVLTADVGSPVVWAARYLTMNGRRRLIGSFNHGSMANALLHGIGAQATEPDRQVVALAGDGGLAMMLGELLTLTQNDLPVKTIVVNNSSLNFVELEMKAAGFVNYGTDLVNPDFAAVAESLGILGRRVERSDELPDALAEVLAHDGPALLDVVCERQELSMPPAITAAQMKGFTLYALRTVMSGRGDELLDLAKANWRQLF